MTVEAPQLTPEILDGELARFHSQQHRTLNTAFFGRGEPAQVRVTVRHVEHEFKIVPVRSELELRRALRDAETRQAPIVLLADYDERLPPDVRGRLAGGRLHFISPERRLGSAFDVQRVAPTLVESPLGHALLRAGWRFPRPSGVAITTIDLETAWRRFLDKAIGLSSGEALTEEGVLDFLASHGPSTADPLLGKLLTEVRGLAEALEHFWEAAVGPVAVVAWRNWRGGRAADVLAMSFVLDALVDSLEEGAVKVFLSLRLREFGDTKVTASHSFLKRWAGLAPALYLRLGDGAPAILKRADHFVDEPALREILRKSRFLTPGFDGMKAELADCIAAAVSGVNSTGEGVVRNADVGTAVRLYQKLAGHRLAKAAENAALMTRTIMGLRLLAYLPSRIDWQAELKDHPPVEPAYRLAASFSQEGGFVDLARRLVRGGHDSDPLDAALGRVADAADAYRDQMDSRFARALALWNEDRRPGRLLPIEDALSELGVTFLQEGEHRRLLILLMDGMSWATAAEIILDIRDVGYSLLRWRAPRASREFWSFPMIAALPTMTEVSRAALFAGKLLQAGEQTSTMRDPERLQAHKGFVKAFGDGPTLLLRTDAESQTGHLTDAARKLVDGSDRVVGVVVNAVDDQLTGKPGYLVHSNRTTIKALEPLLTLARDAGRAVLLVGDHGHVTSSRPHTSVDAGKTEKARYREIDATASVSEREIVLSGANVFTERKGKRLALLYAETDRYISQRHVGEHGGASLAEVVTPALMIGSQDLRALVGEEGEALGVVAYPVPAWWYLNVAVEKKAAAAAVSPPKAPGKSGGRSKSPGAESQLVLTALEPSATAESGTPVVAGPSRWETRLREIFADLEKGRKQDLLKRVIPAVDLLVAHGGRLAEEAFAGARGEAPRNVGGLVALMAEFLNEDSYQVIEHDVAGKQVRLNLDRLQELFGG
ncbi:MAG: BREX-2 system phosphatase PglZ [Myxococcales bacterium]